MKDAQRFQESFEKSLLEHLNKTDVKEVALKKYSRALTDIYNDDILIEKVWVVGQPPIERMYKGLEVQARIGIKDLEKLNLFFKHPDVHKVEIFPVGIIAPEFLEVQFRMGERLPRG